MARSTFGRKLRYRFDNLMARGVGAQIGLLAVATVGMLLVFAALLVIVGVAPEGEDGERPSFGRLLWSGLMHTIDSGAVGGDVGSWTFLFLMLAITIGGIFVLSALIGILTGGFGQIIENLRKGRSEVMERRHTVILGWNDKIGELLGELATAAANQPGAAVAILAEKDKVEMDDFVRETLGKRSLRVITRTGSPLALADLAIVNPAEAKAIVVLAPDDGEDDDRLAASAADTLVLKTLLAVHKTVGGRAQSHVVAEVQHEETVRVARMVVGDAAALILTPRLISRLLVQTGRQSGLSAVYMELLSFDGDEVYTASVAAVTGKTFREAISAFEDSAVLGVLGAGGKLQLPPPMDRVMEAGDRIVAVSADDDTVIANGQPTSVDEAALAPLAPHAAPRPERTLVLGASTRLGLVLRELDGYVAAGSQTLVVGEIRDEASQAGDVAGLTHMSVRFLAGDTTERKTLDALDPTSFDHVLVLSELEGRSLEVADARTMITLLHLRDIGRRAGKVIKVTTEMLDSKNRELAAVAEADDFIVSNSLISLVVSQVAENKELQAIFDQLLSEEGHEIYLKPATDYVKPGVDVDFYTVVEAAARRNEVALGYRVAANAQNAESSFGVVLNPKKRIKTRFAPADRIIVLAER